MRLTWQAILKDGTIVKENETIWAHLDQSLLKRLDIVNANGMILYSTAKLPIYRCHRVLSHQALGELHVVESGAGPDFELALCDEADGSVEVLKVHGHDVRSRPIDRAVLDVWRKANPPPPKLAPMAAAAAAAPPPPPPAVIL